MWETLSDILIALLAVAGLVALARTFFNWLFRPVSQKEKRGKLYLVLSLHGHEPGAEMLLRGAAERIRFGSEAEEKRVLCVDRGMDGETKEICQRTAEQLPVICVCSPEEAAREVAEGRT